MPTDRGEASATATLLVRSPCAAEIGAVLLLTRARSESLSLCGQWAHRYIDRE